MSSPFQEPLPVVRSRRGGLSLTEFDRDTLANWSRSGTAAARVVLRSRIVLMLADGEGVKAVAAALDIAPGTVRLWRTRFESLGPNGLLKDAPGRGRKPALDVAARQALRLNAGTIGVRASARALGVSPSTVSRWRRRES